MAGIDKLLVHHNKVLLWLEAAPEGYSNFLKEWAEREVDKLRKEREPQLLYQAQGAVLVLERLIGLRQELRDYAKRTLTKEEPHGLG